MRTSLTSVVRRLAVALMIFVTQAVIAQTVKVTGLVTDPQHEPLMGVVVTEKGKSSGVLTDVNGNYTINVSPSAVLTYTFTGFTTRDEAVKGRTTIDVVLTEDLQNLDEVVVVGYGTMRRKDLTGAVASVKGDEVAALPVANVAEALQGKLPGVNVTTQDGRPGASVSVRVRGGGSITQSNDPLFVVDGFPVSNINNLSANEIESIDVLKDASSTAIYGARGANGVILVTTKKAQEGKIRVSYDGYAQAKHVAKTLETLSAQEYIFYNWGYASSRGEGNADAVAKYFGLGSKYGNHYADYANVTAHDYTDDILRTAWVQSHNVSVTGGTEKTKIAFTAGYVGDQGIKINSDYNRFNTSFKLYQKIFSNLTLDLDVRYSETNLNGREDVSAGKGSNVSGAYLYRPIDNPLGGVSWSDVSGGFSFGVYNIDDDHNPVELINDITDKSNNTNLRGSAALSWEIIKGLTARSEISLSRRTSQSQYYENGYTNKKKKATLTNGTSKGLRWLNTVNYNVDFNKDNSLGVLIGHELIKNDSEVTSLSGEGYPDSYDFKTTMGLIHTATEQFNSMFTYGVPNHTLSYFGRMNYTLLDRYMLTATFRADGSSKFAPNNRWGYFPAVAAGWRISDESFMSNTRDWLSFLKLRLSWGESGADNISSNLWRETWSSKNAGSNHYPINGVLSSIYQPDGLLANPDLKWETTVSRNIGIDYGFLNSRINGSVEVYWNTTKDLLMAVPVDNTTGYTYQYQNFGQTSNRGFEISVHYNVVNTRDFRFDINAIYNYNRNKLDKMPNAEQYLYTSNWGSSSLRPSYDYMLEEGKAIGLVRGLQADGFYTTSDFNIVNGQYILKEGVADLTSAVTEKYLNPFDLPNGQVAFPGAAKFVDENGDGKIDEDDVVCLGEVMPSHTGSFQFNFGYKNFDLSTNFNWAAGGKVYNVNSMLNASGGEYNWIGANRVAWVADTYKVYNVDAAGEIYAVTNPEELDNLNRNAKYHTPYHQAGIVTSEWLEDGSYLRLQSATLGYTLPKNLLKKVSLEQVRFYFTATNIFTLTHYSGLDPEVSSYTAGSSKVGNMRNFPTYNMDYGSYPRARTYTLGVSVQF